MTEKEFVSLENCVHRHVYRLKSRNLLTGVFDAAQSGFIGIREKFGRRYLFTEFHWDTGPPFGTVQPLEDLGVLPDEIELKEYDESDTQTPVAYRPLFDFLEPEDDQESRRRTRETEGSDS